MRKSRGFREGRTEMKTLSEKVIFGFLESKEAFPIDFEAAWQWLGYSRKDNAKTKLIGSFTQDVDYQVFLNVKERKTREGGTNKETIKLSNDCFKAFAMLAATEKGKEVRNYFLECERKAQKLIKSHTRITNFQKKGYSVSWAIERDGSIDTRNTATSVLMQRKVDNKGIVDCTNAIYKNIFGKKAAQLKEERGITRGLRDTFSEIELLQTRLTEAAATENIKRKRLAGNDPCVAEYDNVSRLISQSVNKALKS